MENYFKPVLSEEQMAAYLDGMLSTEESAMVEEQIMADPEMQEIQDSIDDVDTSLAAYDETQELPLECLSDNFELPAINYALADGSEAAAETDVDYTPDAYYENEDGGYQDYQCDYEQEQPYDDGAYDDISF